MLIALRQGKSQEFCKKDSQDENCKEQYLYFKGNFSNLFTKLFKPNYLNNTSDANNLFKPFFFEHAYEFCTIYVKTYIDRYLFINLFYFNKNKTIKIMHLSANYFFL